MDTVKIPPKCVLVPGTAAHDALMSNVSQIAEFCAAQGMKHQDAINALTFILGHEVARIREQGGETLALAFAKILGANFYRMALGTAGEMPQ